MKPIVTKKKSGKEWAKVDISQLDVRIPKEGIYIVFEVLDYEDYKVKIIESNIGFISAVPTLPFYKYDPKYVRKSYTFGYNENKIGKRPPIEWKLFKGHFLIDIELN